MALYWFNILVTQRTLAISSCSFKELSPEACVFNVECFLFVLRLCLLFTFRSDFIYYAINCYYKCLCNEILSKAFLIALQRSLKMTM